MEEKMLLLQAAEEIRSLKKQNQLMASRLDVFDSMMRVFNSNYNSDMCRGESEDLVYKIEKYLESKKQA